MGGGKASVSRTRDVDLVIAGWRLRPQGTEALWGRDQAWF